MAEQEQTKAITVQGYLNNKTVQSRLRERLDKRADQFITSVIAIANSNNKIAECRPDTVINAAITAATLDLPITPGLGFAFIVPYRDKKQGPLAQFQIGYRGYLQLAQRSGQYKTIAATPVYEGQLVDEDPLLGNTYDWKAKKSDNIIGYVAMFKLVNGFEKELYMSTEDILKHAKRYSKAYQYDLEKNIKSSPWSTNFDDMACKTLIRLLIPKFGPMSVEMQRAFLTDEGVIKGEDDEVIEFVDNTNELQEAIDKTSTQSELKEVIDAMAPEDQVKMAEAAAKRLEELAE